MKVVSMRVKAIAHPFGAHRTVQAKVARGKKIFPTHAVVGLEALADRASHG